MRAGLRLARRGRRWHPNDARPARGAPGARAIPSSSLPAKDLQALELLNAVGVALSSELDLNRLVHMIVEAATALSGAAYGSFFERALLPGTGEEVWRLYALTGAPEEAFTRFGLPRATALFGPTFGGRAIRSDDVLTDPLYGSLGGMPKGHLPVRSYLAIPVVARSGERLGALLFGHPEPGRFSAATERLITGFAGQAASAIDNAKLFREVRLSEDRFRAAVAAIQGVLWTNDAEGRMMGEQPGWAALTGQSFEAYQGYGWADAVHPEDSAPTVEEWNRCVADRRPFIFEHRVRRRDGSFGRYAIRAIPILEADGSIREWVGVHTDITDQREAEAALRASNEDLQSYAHMISHDLRTPLVNIMGFSSELRALKGELFNGAPPPPGMEAEFDEALGFIRSATDRMDRLLSAVLRLSREGRRQLRPSALDLRGLVDQLLAAQGHQIQAAEAVVTVGEFPALSADRAAVEQVLGNLIDNAIKYRSPARPLRLGVEGRRKEDRVELTVSDNGVGLAAGDVERAFQMFRRLGPQASPGEGVGLAYVKTLVQAMGGAIRVESTPGVGSRFIVNLPAG